MFETLEEMAGMEEALQARVKKSEVELHWENFQRAAADQINTMKAQEELEARKTYERFVLAAMQGMLANPNFSEMEYEDIGRYACKHAKATIEQMVKE